MRLNGEVSLVTGAGSGFGEGIAHACIPEQRAAGAALANCTG